MSSQLGVAHPPGYPLFTLLGYLFSQLPFGEVAWRVNLFSAFCSAGAAAFLYLTVLQFGSPEQFSSKSKVFGALTALIFAFSPWIWAYATVAEVFALNNFILSAIFFVLVYSHQNGWQKEKYFLVLAFLFGLAAANHHTAALFVLPIALFASWQAYKTPRSLVFWLMIVFYFALGASPYVYMYVVSPNEFAWGVTNNWPGFLAHFLRSDYGTFTLGHEDLSGQSGFWGHLFLFVKGLGLQFFVVGIVPLFYLLKILDTKKPGLNELMVFCLLLYILVFFNLANFELTSTLDLEVTRRFWQQPYLLICVIIGIGLNQLPYQLNAKTWAGISVLLLGMQLGINWENKNQSDNEAIPKLTQEVLKFLPQNAILFTSGDHLSSAFAYQNRIQGVRKDVDLINGMMILQEWYIDRRPKSVTYPGSRLGYGPGQFSLRSLFRANQSRPMFIINDLRVTDEPMKPYSLVPLGWVDKILKPNEEINVADWKNQNEEFFSKIDESYLSQFSEESWEHELHRLYWRQYYKYAAHLLKFSLEQYEARKFLKDSLTALEKVEPHLYSGGRPLFQGIENYHKNVEFAKKRLGM